ncbi:hypothetical protein JCM8097_001093 [Rhodosporidiobolus ruineniae]
MSFAAADFRPRTVSSQLRAAGGLEDGPGSSPALSAHAWADWGATGYSPDRAPPAPGTFPDPYADLMSENAFGDFGGQRAPPGGYAPGLGFEMPLAMNGIEEEPAQGEGEANEGCPGAGERAALSSSAFLPAQPAPAYSSYPASSAASSPARSRASSLHSVVGSSLQMSTLTSPASPFFPGGLPSPFHDHPSSFGQTIHPAQSVRDSSPSDTSSVSNLNLSAASSVYGSGGADSVSTAPSTPHRSNSISSRGTGSDRQSHQKHLRRRSSPIKGANRHARKLSNADRKRICQFHLMHPGLKQDDIGAHFGFERSTISKTLKYKERYLAMDSDDESSASAVIRTAEQERRTQHPPAPPPSRPSPEESYGDYGVGSQSSLVASSSVSSLVSLDSYASNDSVAPTASIRHGTIVGGRFPQIDNALASWAREQVPHGLPLTDSALQQEARRIARELGSDNFKASQTWLDGFKSRAGISHGTFQDLLRQNQSPPAPVPTPTPTSQRWLPPPKEDEDEEAEDAGQRDEEGDEDYDLPSSTRRSKRRLGAKTVRRLTSAKSALASFADGVMSRSSTPASQRTAAMADHDLHGGSFGDLSMDADGDATPTHTSVHSRASTAATERPSGLAGPFTYSPTGASETGSVVVASTPSRTSHVGAPSQLEYSPSDPLGFSSAFGYPGGLSTSCSSQDLAAYSQDLGASTHSSLANFDGGSTSLAGSYLDSATASPAPMFQHGRSGSTTSSNSVYSGLTAFSTHSQGPGTPLTGSFYGSFRDSQTNLCSVPGTPAGGLNGAAATAYFGSSQEQQHPQQYQSGAPSASQPPYAQQNVPQPQTQHQRYPHKSQHQHQQQQAPDSAGRRATISGGAPFAGRGSTAMSASLSLSQLSVGSNSPLPSPLPRGCSPAPSLSASTASTSAAGSSATLEQAYSSLEVALSYLSTSAGQRLMGPKDLVVLSELSSRLGAAARASAHGLVHPSALSASTSSVSSLSAPPTPAPGQSPFGAAQQGAQAPMAAFASPTKARRFGLTRTQSASCVPTYGGGGASTPGWLATAGALERVSSTRRSGSAASLYEVDGH